MEYRFEQDTGRLVLVMPREVDHHSAKQLRQDTEILMDRYPVRGLVFDFQDTVFMDSSGIGVILGRCKHLQYTGGEAVAVHLGEQVQRIFRLSGLHKLIKTEI